MQLGNSLPEFEAKNQKGEVFNSEQLKNKWSVVYFYPKNFTPGCTKEACSFRDAFEDFQTAGARVVGISKDSVESHMKFNKAYNLPFDLLADEDGKLHKLFEVPKDLFGLVSGRVTYIFNPEGKLHHYFKSQLRADQHVKEALRSMGDS